MSSRRLKQIIKLLLLICVLNLFWMVYNIGSSENEKVGSTKPSDPLDRVDRKQENNDIGEQKDIPNDIPVEVEVRKPVTRQFQFVFNHPDACEKFQELPLVVLVTSAPHQYRLRAAVRKTWMSSLQKMYEDVVVLFIVGKTSRSGDQKNVINENNIYGDIVQLDMVDSEKNETVKLIGALQWAAEFCPNAKYMLSVSDRMVLVNDYLIKYIKDNDDKKKVALGYLKAAGQPSRNPASKYYVSEETWPGDKYPPYLLAPVYLLSIDVVLDVYAKTFTAKRFPLEDIYLALLLKDLGITPQHHDGFKPGYINNPMSDISGICRRENEFVWGVSSPEQTKEIWAKVSNVTCTNTPVLEQKAAPVEVANNPPVEVAQNNPPVANVPANQPVQAAPVQAVAVAPVPLNAGAPMVENPSNRIFISNHSELCSEKEIHTRVNLIIFTISDPENGGRRQAIRETWGEYTRKLPGRRVHVVFIVGLSADDDVNDKVVEENKKNKDVVIVKESCKQRTRMTVLAFEWINKFCIQAKWMMKADDHMIVNLDNLLRYIDTLPIMRVIVGHIHEGGKPDRSVISQELFADATYPNYPNGAAYLMAQDIARDILPALKKRSSFPLADVFFGLAAKDNGFKMTDHAGFDTSGDERSMCDLKFLLAIACPQDGDLVLTLYRYWREWQWSEFEDCNKESSTFSGLSYDNKNAQDHFIPITDGAVSKPHSFDFRINHPDACKKMDEVTLFAGILSSPANASTRNSIRETWGRYYADSDKPKIVCLFLLAIPPGDSELLTAVDEENEKYGDILQQTFMESYDHLVLKTLMLYRYVAEYCQKAKYVLKIDEDVFMHTYNMMAYLKDAPKTNFYFGDSLVGTEPLRVIENKWYTPRHVWPHDTYPTYNAGPAYLMSGDLALKVYEASRHSKPFRWEDLYVGILVAGVGGAPLPHNHYDMHGMYRHRCSVRQSLVSHHMWTNMYYRYWIQLNHLRDTNTCQPPLHQKHDPYTSLPPGDAIEKVDWSRQDQYSCSHYAREFKSPVYLLVIIRAHTLDYVVRKWLRTTWATSGIVKDKRILVYFLVDKITDDNVMMFLKNEHRMFLDVIIMDNENAIYAGKPYNAQAITWAYENCLDLEYLMITQQPMYVDFENVISVLEKSPKTKLMLGKIIENDKPSRDKNSEHYVSEDEWPSDVYPPYLNNKAFIMSKDVMKGLAKSSRIVKPIANHGAYLGIMLAGIFTKPTHHDGFQLDDPRAIDQICTKVDLLAADYVEWVSMTDARLSGTMFKTCPKMTGSRRYINLLKDLE